MKKLISWNVNGLRACVGKGFLDFFKGADADSDRLKMLLPIPCGNPALQLCREEGVFRNGFIL